MIHSVITNLKRHDGQPVKYHLDQRTLIVGSSASGKSTITQAVELACAQRMSDFQGRQDSSLRTVQDAVVIDGAKTIISLEGDPGPLLFSPVLEAIQSNPIAAHIELLGKRWLSTEALDLFEQLKAGERLKRDIAGKIGAAKAVEAFMGRQLETLSAGVSSDPASQSNGQVIRCEEASRLREKASADINTFEGAVKELESKLDGLKGALRLAIAAAWTDDVLDAVSVYIPSQLGSLRVQTEGFGLGLQRRNEPVRWALSGSEFNIVVTALAAEGSEVLPAAGSTVMPVLVPHDRAIDPGLLEQWMAALSKAPVQVLLTTTVKPGKVPKGWNVLEISAASDKPGTAKKARARK